MTQFKCPFSSLNRSCGRSNSTCPYLSLIVDQSAHIWTLEWPLKDCAANPWWTKSSLSWEVSVCVPVCLIVVSSHCSYLDYSLAFFSHAVRAGPRCDTDLPKNCLCHTSWESCPSSEQHMIICSNSSNGSSAFKRHQQSTSLLGKQSPGL